jgi:hypothetical protein
MVGRGALWITGLAVALAAFSYVEWWQTRHGRRLRHALSTPRFLTPFSLGMALFSAGLALSSRRWWEIGAWAVLAVLFLLQAWAYWRAGAREGWDEPPRPSIHEREERESCCNDITH